MPSGVAPATLGKRKRSSSSTAKARAKLQEDPSTSDTEDLQEVFRRHFEAKFKPLSPAKKSREADNVTQELEAEDGDDEGDADSWGGVSSDDAGDNEDVEMADGIEVVEHTGLGRYDRASKAEMKAFMVRQRTLRSRLH